VVGTNLNAHWTIYQITFCNDCPKEYSNMTLNLVFNGYAYVFRSLPTPWQYFGVYGSSLTTWTFQTLSIPVACGNNQLTIYVYAKPPWLGYWITQDQRNCYNCKNSLTGFYNRETCQCECVKRCKCDSPLMWYDYPSCGCGC